MLQYPDVSGSYPGEYRKEFFLFFLNGHVKQSWLYGDGSDGTESFPVYIMYWLLWSRYGQKEIISRYLANSENQSDFTSLKISLKITSYSLFVHQKHEHITKNLI